MTETTTKLLLSTLAQKEKELGTIRSATQRPIGLLSIDTKSLAERLTRAEIGDLVPYEELSTLIGRNVQEEGRGNLESARAIALREQQVVFGVVRNVGLKRLNDSEIINSGQADIDHIRRSSKRALRRITSLRNYDELPNEIKIRHNTFASLFGVMAHITGSTQVKRLEGRVEKAQNKLPFTKTLEAFDG